MQSRPIEWAEDKQDRVLISVVSLLALVFSCAYMLHLTLRTWNPSFRTLWMPLLILGIWVAFRRLRLLVAMWPYLNKPMFILLAWCFVTALWSPDMMFSITQAIGISCLSVIAVAFAAAGWNSGRLSDVISVSIAFILALSLFYAIAYPDIGVHSEDNFELLGAWRGITYQKNYLGQIGAIGVIFWLHRLLTHRDKPLVAAAFILLSLALLVQSRSNTSLILALICCLPLIFILRPGLRIGWLARRSIYISLVVVIPVVGYLLVATSVFDFVSIALGKGDSFTGRGPIWIEIMDEIGEHPILGIGFSAFWRGPDSPAGAIIKALQWQVPSSHNAYLDITNETGLIGFGLFLLMMAYHVRAVAILSRINQGEFALQVAATMYLVLANFSESGWFQPNDTTHFVGMMCILHTNRLIFSEALRRAAGENPPPDPVPAENLREQHA